VKEDKLRSEEARGSGRGLAKKAIRVGGNGEGRRGEVVGKEVCEWERKRGSKAGENAGREMGKSKGRGGWARGKNDEGAGGKKGQPRKSGKGGYTLGIGQIFSRAVM